jgi:hypothetical protein
MGRPLSVDRDQQSLNNRCDVLVVCGYLIPLLHEAVNREYHFPAQGATTARPFKRVPTVLNKPYVRLPLLVIVTFPLSRDVVHTNSSEIIHVFKYGGYSFVLIRACCPQKGYNIPCSRLARLEDKYIAPRYELDEMEFVLLTNPLIFSVPDVA